MLMKKIILLLLSISIFNNCIAQQTITDTLYHNGFTRNFNVFLPVNYVEGESLPLVFNFHGLGSNMTQQQFYSEMDTVANEQNFIVCYPDGIDNAWNSGFGGSVDDVGFTDKMIGYIHEKYNIDLSRVYSCGMSNGGYMSYSLSCELSERFAAIASVTGSMAIGYMPTCNPERILPFMQIHGTNDNTVQYNGDGISASIDDVVSFWTEKWMCAPIDITFTDVADIDITDETTATNYKYFCDADLIGELYVVEGGAHTWPGASFEIDVTNNDFEASEVIWEFFNQFSTENPPTPLVGLNDNVLANKFVVQPNPFTNNVTVEGHITINNLEVYNINGRLLKIIPSNELQTTIDLSDLQPGLYYLKLTTAEGNFTKTLIKK